MVLKSAKQQLSNRIRAARLENKMSSIKVSRKMKLSDSMCSQWERGISNPSTAHLIKLAEVLKVSFEWLATGKSSPINILENSKQNTEDVNTKILQINQMLHKTTDKQKDYLLKLLIDITS